MAPLSADDLPIVGFFCLFSLLALSDLYWHTLPHLLTLPAILLAFYFAPALPASHPLNAFLGGLVAFTLFMLIRRFAHHRFGRSSLGDADPIVATLIGSSSGLLWGLWALAVGMILGGGGALFWLWVKKGHKQTPLPYATFLLAGQMGVWLLYYLR